LNGGANPLAGWVPAPRAPRAPVLGVRLAASPSPPPLESDSDASAEESDGALQARRAELPAGGKYALETHQRDAISAMFAARDGVSKETATALAHAVGTTEIALRHFMAKLRDSVRQLTRRADAVAAESGGGPTVEGLEEMRADRVATLARVAPLLDPATGGLASPNNASSFVEWVGGTASHTVRAAALGAVCSTADPAALAALADAGAGVMVRGWLADARAGGHATEVALAAAALAALPERRAPPPPADDAPSASAARPINGGRPPSPPAKRTRGAAAAGPDRGDRARAPTPGPDLAAVAARLERTVAVVVARDEINKAAAAAEEAAAKEGEEGGDAAEAPPPLVDAAPPAVEFL